MNWWRARRRRTKVLLVGLGALLALGIIGQATPTGEPRSQAPIASPSPGSPVPARPAVAATPQPSPTPTPRPTPVSLKGTGQTATAEIRLPTPISVASFTHTGRRNFIVQVFRGSDQDLLINTIGAYQGDRPLLGAAPVRLNIEADGAWTVTIAAIEGGGSPSVTGRGDAVSRQFQPPALGTFEFTHDGERNYIVLLHCASGRDLVQNRIGAFEGSTIVRFGRGPCFWEVQADGSWTVKAK